MISFDECLKQLGQGIALSEQEMIVAMEFIMEGRVSDPQLITFLTHLADRGESYTEITGAAKVLRAMAQTIDAPEGTVDCCGTGGDGLGTYNISTAVALVSAACGVPVAKHGNRAASSRSGAADVLEKLGVSLSVTPQKLEAALRQTGFCFLMAPNHHLAMRHVMPARRTLKRRTIFNLIGPLSNPAGTKRQLIGVYDRKFIVPMARALQRLGSEKAWVVHGADGLDEISLSGETYVAALEGGELFERTLTPDDFGLPAINNRNIIGGDVHQNAAALLAVLEGEKNAYRAVVQANVAAVLSIADKVKDLKEGVAIAGHAIDSGKALAVLTTYRDMTS